VLTTPNSHTVTIGIHEFQKATTNIYYKTKLLSGAVRGKGPENRSDSTGNRCPAPVIIFRFGDRRRTKRNSRWTTRQPCLYIFIESERLFWSIVKRLFEYVRTRNSYDNDRFMTVQRFVTAGQKYLRTQSYES